MLHPNLAPKPSLSGCSQVGWHGVLYSLLRNYVSNVIFFVFEPRCSRKSSDLPQTELLLGLDSAQCSWKWKDFSLQSAIFSAPCFHYNLNPPPFLCRKQHFRLLERGELRKSHSASTNPWTCGNAVSDLTHRCHVSPFIELYMPETGFCNMHSLPSHKHDCAHLSHFTNPILKKRESWAVMSSCATGICVLSSSANYC